MTIHIYSVKEEDINKRIDGLLAHVSGYSRQKVKQLIKEKQVTVNDQHIKPSYKCQLEDKIKWEEFEEEAIEILAEDIPLDILYEDDDIIVLNKEKGMMTHPAQHHKQATLVNALLYHTDSLSNLSGEDRLGIVHRLDKDTSGLIVVAKHNEAHEKLVEQFKARTVKRQYEAIVHGVIKDDYGIIRAPIGRDPNNRQNMTVIESGKEAETHFTVLNRYKDYTHVSCELKTGRTHQIRVHMKFINHPLVGDPKYGYKRKKQVDGQLLYAQHLSFIHPTRQEEMTFTVDYPTQFKKMLERLQKMT